MTKKLPLHWQIIMGMLAGIGTGFLAIHFNNGSQFIINWVKPFGTIFINMLKLIAIPLIITSLIKGVADLQDITQLSRLGIRTFALYIVTTVAAVTVGLTLVNTINPGKFVSEKTRTDMIGSFGDDVSKKVAAAEENKKQGPLQPLVDVVPDNFFGAASSNGNMLQVIFFVILFGVGLILIPSDKSTPVKVFFEGCNEVILKIIDIIMLYAPIGVFALLAALVAESPATDIFIALGVYALTVLAGLAFLILAFYPFLVRMFAGKGYLFFLRGIAPAQLVAFSTSSSAATLPVTIEEHLGVEKEVSSFVLPIGATVNMDGTSLYQAVAAVFIAQVLGNHLTLGDQLTIILTATLASIGAAAVPGAGLLMLIVVLEAIGVNPAGIALIIAIDRPLDMCRTMANVTSDAAVSMIVAKQLGKLSEPKPKNWDDSLRK